MGDQLGLWRRFHRDRGAIRRYSYPHHHRCPIAHHCPLALPHQHPAGRRQRRTKDVISYSYTPKGQLGSVTNQAGTTWSYNYDFAGRKVTDIDPDKGTSTTTYDDLHRPVTVTDARNITLTTSYDVLSRPVLVKNGAATVQTWAYDTATLGKGKLASSTVTVDGADYVQAVAAYDSNGLATSSSVTVSYTHLDVYKRQNLLRPAGRA